MIKAFTRTKNGRPLLILGLSGENVTRLVAGEPILVKTEDLGMPPGLVYVFYGRTEEEITEYFKKKFTIGEFRDEKTGHEAG